MHSAIPVWIGLILLGSISISQCRRDFNEDSDEMALDQRDFDPVAREQRYDYETLLKRLSFPRRTCTSGCTPACKADQLCIAPNLCACPNGHISSPCPTQGSSCLCTNTANVDPVLSITFGQGTSQYSTATPASLGFNSKYPQITSKKQVTDGNYAIVNQVPQDFGSWLGGGLDHTTSSSGGTSKGYMMLVNAQNAAGGEILNAKATNLCPGLRYEFYLYVANVVKKGTNIIKPNIQLEVRTATSDNTLLATASTGDVQEQSQMTWIQYGFSFTTPATSVILRLISNAPGGSGDDFAIDDISLVSCSQTNNGVCH